MRPTLRLEPYDSLALAATRFRENGARLVPVVDMDRLVGAITERSLARAIGDGVEPTDACSGYMEEPPRIHPYESGAEALRRVAEGETLVVIDDLGRVMGLVSSVDLWARRRVAPRPAAVGGMATPFGVYLTTGTVTAGVHPLALVATGSAMMLMLVAATLVTDPILDGLLRLGVAERVLDFFANGLLLALFLVLMRLVPLSGTHGAEHQVVNAIERDEELRPEIVARMPRVHPRCGTNLAAGATIFTSLFLWEWTTDVSARFLVAVFATLLSWRAVGRVLQQYVTTRKPSRKQLLGGIRAGEELLARYQTSRLATAHPLMRIWNSGMLQVIAGASLTAAAVGALARVFHLPIH